MNAYSKVYEALSEMREAFHRYGRIDDSNAKLDEVAKLFAAYLAHRRGKIAGFPQAGDPNIIEALSEAFKEAAFLTEYLTNEGHSIFGSFPRIVLRKGDEALAHDLTCVVRKAVDAAFEAANDEATFDVLNEAFGHFIRDNFRSNIEDAQYMTPPEVVEFMADLAIAEIANERSETKRPKSLTIIDPSCGVGSFLAAFYNRASTNPLLANVKLNLVGQDKVERMVRLTALNMALFEIGEHHVTIGNSLEQGSPLDAYNDQVDLILTNPPFGARFDHEVVKAKFGQNTPFFNSLVRASGKIDSELLFIDRALRLLKPGGRLLIVVPDGVVSAKGVPAILRHYVQGKAALRAVVELPSVTFAQAGTRTRTSIVYLQKANASVDDTMRPPVALACIESLGYSVSSRKGVQIKQIDGSNELPSVLKAFVNLPQVEHQAGPAIVSESPSVTTVPANMFGAAGWAPSQFSASRLNVLNSIKGHDDLDVVPFEELADLVSGSRRAQKPAGGIPYMSVLHISGDGIIDVRGVREYRPKTPGLPVYPGELLFSRLNPHITRIAVVPNLAEKLLCSSEFEIIVPKGALDVYALAYLMNSKLFLKQVFDLCSGTSSSHSRVRSEQVAKIMFAVPRVDTPLRVHFDSAVERYRSASKQLVSSLLEIADLRDEELTLIPAPPERTLAA
jgi:type I restriction-modification system DNA methylase subunit